jgi:ribosomal protein L3 glutamine methyltransferase
MFCLVWTWWGIIPQSRPGFIRQSASTGYRAESTGLLCRGSVPGNTMNTLRSVRDFIRWGASRFVEAGLVFGHGTDNALDESAALVMHALHLGTGLPDDCLDAVLNDTARKEVIRLVESRISTRKPAAYLTHEAWFSGLPFYIDERVLVPRSPIAELIANRFIPWVVPDRIDSILDLCTGSGCIAIACACVFPDARVLATDISDDALAVARTNIDRHGLARRVHLLQGSLFERIGERHFDLIVSNPPYVPQTEIQQLPQEFRHEPELGLSAGEDGLDVVVEILRHASRHLADAGILVVEVGCSQTAVVEQYPEIPFLWLEFEHGGEGVFLLEQAQLREHQPEFERVARLRSGAAGRNARSADHV